MEQKTNHCFNLMVFAWWVSPVGIVVFQEPLKSDWKKNMGVYMGQKPAKMVRCPPSTVECPLYMLTRCAGSFPLLIGMLHSLPYKYYQDNTKCFAWHHNVDGSEILHQLIGSLSHYLHGFIHPRWCRSFSINSIICLSHHVRTCSHYFIIQPVTLLSRWMPGWC